MPASMAQSTISVRLDALGGVAGVGETLRRLPWSGTSVDGEQVITDAKFQGQLRKNKETLVKQYSCKRVKFTVYEKDGKAALKATPIKES